MKPRRPGRVAGINTGIAIVLAIALAGTYLALRPARSTASSAALRTATVARTDVTATVSATGTSEPVSTTQVSFAVAGTVASLRVHAGSVVKKGQVLATLATTDLQHAVDVAQAKYDAAAGSYSAAVQGYDDAVAAQSATTSQPTTGQGQSGGQSGAQSVASASAQVASAKANKLQSAFELQSAKDALSEATLKSPVAGTVLAVNAVVGGSASGSGGSSGGTGSGTGGSTTSGAGGVVTIADLSAMQVSASFAEADAMQLKVGQTATTVFNAATGDPVSGKITAIAPTPSTSGNVVSYPVTVSLSSLPQGLRAGQTATVTVTTGARSNVLAVPRAAVTGSGTERTVTVVSGGQQAAVAVQVGLEGDQWAEITSGLTEGQQVVLPTTSTTTGGFPGRGQFPGGGVGQGGAGFGGGGFGGAVSRGTANRPGS
ncbi:MAG TPA: biotin/lipoyl-binding protein [Angustibacter sp.]|nr:biotin/lipoyl-binding protein [Angustibacter sp.]